MKKSLYSTFSFLLSTGLAASIPSQLALHHSAAQGTGWWPKALPGELKPVGCTEHTYFISKLCHNFNSVHAIILETCVQTSNIRHSWGHSFMYTLRA